MSTNRILDMAEAAAFLRCGERYLRELVANKGIPHCKLAGKALFLTARLEEWLLEQEVQIERTPSDTSGASDAKPQSDRVAVRPDCDKERVDSLILELENYRTPKDKRDRFVAGLAGQLAGNFKESTYQWLTRKTYSRLSRWCHPQRGGQRNDWVQDRAREIAKELFGDDIERTSDPSYE